MSAFIITLRETLEAAIIIGIIFSLLKAFWIDWSRKIYVIYGIILWIISSFLFSFAIESLFWEFEWKIEKMYEWILMLVAAAMITHFIIWTNAHFKNIGTKLKKWIQTSLEPWKIWVLTILAFVSVIREWVETVIFLKSAEFAGLSGGIFYALGWFFSACAIALVIFFIIKSINISNVIKATNVIFVLLWAGLLSHAVSEFEWAWILPKIMKPLFDLNSTFLSEKNGIWALLKAALSYDADPSLLAFSLYIGYILIISYILFFRRREQS